MVGRLVEQQHLRLLQQDLTQPDAHLPPTRESGHGQLVISRREAHRAEHTVDSPLDSSRILRVELRLQLLHPAERRLHHVGVIARARERLLGLGVLLLEPLHLAKRRDELLLQRAAVAEVLSELLTQEGDLDVGRALDELAPVQLELLREHAQLRRLASAVVANEADPLTRLHVPRDATEDLLVAEAELPVLELEVREALRRVLKRFNALPHLASTRLVGARDGARGGAPTLVCIRVGVGVLLLLTLLLLRERDLIGCIVLVLLNVHHRLCGHCLRNSRRRWRWRWRWRRRRRRWRGRYGSYGSYGSWRGCSRLCIDAELNE